MSISRKLSDHLSQQVSGSTLGIFRLLFGLLMCHEFYEFYLYFSNHLKYSKFLIPHDGFEWLGMIPDQLMMPVFLLLMAASILFALGYYYRLNSAIIAIGFAYVFLVDRGHYNNHFYLYTMMLLFFVVVNARWSFFGKNRTVMIPYWQLFLFKAQLFIVYFYGGIAKIDWDWLQGYPMRYWLMELTQDSTGWVRTFYHSEFGALFFSWSGLIFDLLVGFGLFSRRWRRISIVFAIAFHIHNEMTFTIGSFPTAMICALILFAHPNLGNEIAIWIGGLKDGRSKVNWKRIPGYIFRKSPPLTHGTEKVKTVVKDQASKLYLYLLTCWFAIQLVVPFRHFLYPGDPGWTGEGHLFAWRMMLVDTVHGVRYSIVDEETGNKEPVDLLYYVTWRQFYKMSRTPKSYVKFAEFLKDEIKKNNPDVDPLIKMEIIKSVNDRPPRLLNDTTLNYAEVEAKSFGHAEWIQPWNKQLDSLRFSDARFLEWQKYISEYEGHEEAIKNDSK